MPIPKLIILRGNSGSGKSAVAKRLREVSGRKIAIVGQDNIRREILKEKEIDNGENIALIELVVEFALGRGFDVVLEGIFKAQRYGDMLRRLSERCADTYVYYFDISFEETLRRHSNKPNAHEFGEKEMREWYMSCDLLGHKNEKIISENSSLEDSVRVIIADTNLFPLR